MSWIKNFLSGDDPKSIEQDIKKFEEDNKQSKKYLRKILLEGIKRVVIIKNYLNYIEKEERTRKVTKMAQQNKLNEIGIPIFDGAEYSSWKLRILNMLDFKECKDPATKERTVEDETTWKKMDLKAKTILFSTISNRQLEYIQDCTTTFQMISKLDKMYLNTSTALQILCRGKLDAIKLNKFNSTEEFFIDFERLCNKYKSAGGTLNDEEKIRYIIKALPPDYSYIGDLIDVIPDERRTFEYIQSKIQEKELNSCKEVKKSNVSTFNIKIKGQCWNCGIAGHKRKDCWYGQQNKENGRGIGAYPSRVRDVYQQQQPGNSRGRGTYANRGRSAYQNQPNNRGLHRGAQRGYGPGRGSAHQQKQLQQHPEQRESSLWTTEVSHQLVSNNEQVKVFQNEENNSSLDFANVCESNYCGNVCEIEWLLDSGCTDHLINTDKHFYEFVDLKTPAKVKLPDGKEIKATKLGNIKVKFNHKFGNSKITLQNVYYVEGIKRNLLSYSKITKTCTIVSKNHYSKIYDQNRLLLAEARKVNELYIMKSLVLENFENNIYANSIKLTDKEKWHRALGHVNFDYLNKLVTNKLLNGLPEKLENCDMKCANCIQSKMTNIPFENDRTKTTGILELIHTDLNGPHNTVGFGGEKYFLTFVDDYSKCGKTYCIKNKSETADCLIEYVNLVENKFNVKVKKLQCDNGKEYLNQEIYKFIKQKGIELLPCPPYVHELNGVAERYNRSAMDIGRCLMREAKIDRIYWPEIIKTVSYLKNRTLANTVENKTPYEIFFGEKPNVKHLKIYGSRVFVRIPETLRKSKWDDKAKVGVLVGYNNNSYRVLVNGRIINARHVQVIEDKTNLVCLEKIDNDFHDFDNNSLCESNPTDDKNSYYTQDSNEACDDNQNVNHNENLIDNDNNYDENFDELQNIENVNLNVRKTSSRKKSPIQRYGNPVSHYIYVNYANANVPNTFEEAINSKESKNWIKAMNKEIKCLEKNETWISVDKPKDKKVIDVKWVYKRKDKNTHKARLVVRGYQQKEHLENIYSPVGKMQTLKVLLAYCVVNNLHIEQMDVETAFLNGKIETEVYVSQPKGYEKFDNKVYKLQKALYGLRESPRVWYNTFNAYVEKLGFVRSNYDYCLYVNKSGKDSIYLLVFVDDLLICCKEESKINDIKSSLMRKFIMKDMGKIKSYIGIDIEYSNDRNKMTLSQCKYIESLAKKYNLENAKLYDTPMETNLKLVQATEIDENIKYRNLIGELLYISSGTRPDIAFSVNYLSRYQSCYNETHFKYAMRILKYLVKTKNLNLTYLENIVNKEKLDCMVDSDYAGDNIDRKSTTGYIIRLYGNLIYWKSRKQSTVTKCSTFAEYTAMSEAVTEVLFLKNLLNEIFDLKINEPIKIYQDNSGAVSIAKFGNFTKNSKHIEVQYHYINENYEKGNIDIIKIESNNNLADILTKSLDKVKFLKNRESLKLE